MKNDAVCEVFAGCLQGCRHRLHSWAQMSHVCSQSLIPSLLSRVHVVVYSTNNMPTNSFLEKSWINLWDDFVVADFRTVLFKSGMTVACSSGTISSLLWNFPGLWTGGGLLPIKAAMIPTAGTNAALTPAGTGRRGRPWAVSLQTSKKRCCFSSDVKWGLMKPPWRWWMRPKVDWWLKDESFELLREAVPHFDTHGDVKEEGKAQILEDST